MGILRSEDNYFGLDIGNTGIRLVQLRKGDAKPALVTYGDVALPPELARSDSPQDIDQIAGIVRQLASDCRVSATNVVASLPTESTFVSVIDMPKMTPAELAKAIKFQADQYIPMDVSQVKLDWTEIGPGKTANSMEVLLVAAPNAAAEKQLNIIQKAGLELLALETTATAAARSLVPPSSLAIILLDTSSNSSGLNIIYQNMPRLVRSVPIGGMTFVRAVAQKLGLDQTQAEQFTYRFGMTQTKLEGQVFKAIKPSVDQLIGEIGNSVKFFNERYPSVKVEKIVVTGGTVALPELLPYLSTGANLPVEIGNSWRNVAYQAQLQDKLMSISNHYAVASGLAQRMFI